MRKTMIWILIFVFCLAPALSDVLVQSMPITADEGIVLDVPLFPVLESDVDFRLLFNVFNISNGLLLSDSYVSCSLIVYGVNGSIVYSDVPSFNSSLNKFSSTIPSSVLIDNSFFSRQVFCNDSSSIDFNEFYFKTLVNNGEVSTGSAILNISLLFFFFMLFSLLLVGGFFINGENEFSIKNGEVFLARLNYGYYLKLFLFWMSYIVFWIMTFLMWKISELFALSSLFEDLFRIAFIFEGVLIAPALLFTVILASFKLLAESEELRLAQRGLKKR